MTAAPAPEHLEEWIAAKLDGELTPEETAELHAYLTVHSDGQKLLEEWKLVHARVEEAFKNAQPDEALEHRVLEKFRRATVKPPRDFLLERPKPESFWTRVMIIAIPSVLMLFLGMGLSSVVVSKGFAPKVPPGEITENTEEKKSGESNKQETEIEFIPGKKYREARLEIEVTSWNDATQTITAGVRDIYGIIISNEFAKSPEGKTGGEIVARVPADQLDTFVAGLAALGEVKKQSIETKDPLPDGQDPGPRLRMEREMEKKLFELLKSSGGNISEVLELEKQLARVRAGIEEIEGKLKMSASLATNPMVVIALKER